MAHIFESSYRKIKLQKPRTEREEFGKAKKGLLICKTCGAYYYKKSWHHDAKSFLAKREGKAFVPKFAECPACAMIKRGFYEGIVTIENIPPAYWRELQNLIRRYARRAEERDPMDRLIAIKKEGDRATVTVTENQLAAKLAKKIKDVFNCHANISIKYSKTPSDVGRAKIVFQ